jgi:hypothetical protein
MSNDDLTSGGDSSSNGNEKVIEEVEEKEKVRKFLIENFS